MSASLASSSRACIALSLLLALLTGCSSAPTPATSEPTTSPVPTATPSPTDTPEPTAVTPTPTQEIEHVVETLAECIAYIEAEARLDENGDGKRHRNEPPLKDVPFYFDDKAIFAGRVGPIASNQDGVAEFDGEWPCGSIWVVYAEAPPGFESTTQGRKRRQCGFAHSRETPTESGTAMPNPTRPPLSTATVPPAIATLGDTWLRPADRMILVYVPAGEFEMGSLVLSDAERPVHTVALDGFWIDQTEVTNAQYSTCVEMGVCQAPDQRRCSEPRYFGNASKADHPVVCVDWFAAQAYCEWATARLPTEAEWEYAARAPLGLTYPWGDGFDGTRLNYCDASCRWGDERFDDGYVDTAPAGSFAAGASWCGALDMAGNVWEWVKDWYSSYSSEAQTNPTGPAMGDHKVMRGGSFYDAGFWAQSTYREWFVPRGAFSVLGFRCVVSPTSAQ